MVQIHSSKIAPNLVIKDFLPRSAIVLSSHGFQQEDSGYA